MTSKLAVRLTALLLSVVVASTAFAGDVPGTMNLQAYLLSAGGAPLTGSYKVKITFYPSSSSSAVLWSETHPSVSVAGGLVDIPLGVGTPIPNKLFEDNPDVWVGVSIADEPDLARTPLRSVAYSLQSRTADTAADLQCTSCVELAELSFDPATQAELDAHQGNAAAHHTRYTSAEAVAAMGGKAPANALNHDRYTNGEAVAAMGALGNTNPLNHNRYTDAAAVAAMGAVGNTNPLNHDRYNDAAAIAANAPYYASVDGKTGGSISGNVAVTGTLTAGGKAVCTAAGNCVDKDALSSLSCAASQYPKWSGSAWVCATLPQPATPPECAGPGRVLQWTGGSFTCADVSTGGSAHANGLGLVDSWGYVWDGLERPAASWSAANTVCIAKGARLPTATELYRVSFANGTGEVGSVFTTSWLWSIIEETGGAHVLGKLSDSTISYSVDTTAYPYRCVWPDNTLPYFDGNHCYGPPGAECWTKKGEGNRYHVDLYERAPASYNAAVRECAFYHAHLASERDLTEEAIRGLPNGSGTSIWTSDAEAYYGVFHAGIVKWTGTNTAFDDSWSTFSTWGTKSVANRLRFRCVGVAYDAGAHPKTVASEFVGASTYLKSTTLDTGATTFPAAVSACWAGGGHLPTCRDYHELIADGLPGGSATNIWTSDQEGWNGTQFLLGTVKWSGVDTSFTDYHSTYSTWIYRNGSYGYRCAYYPIDTTYAGPSSCNGGCFLSSRSNAAVKMWADSTDRTTTRYHLAVSTCNAAGGHLASERDFVELIRDGLPNGTGTFVFTSDQEGYNGNNFLVGIISWVGVSTTFDDSYPNRSTWGYKVNSASWERPYRCVWTNELR